MYLSGVVYLVKFLSDIFLFAFPWQPNRKTKTWYFFCCELLLVLATILTVDMQKFLIDIMHVFLKEHII